MQNSKSLSLLFKSYNKNLQKTDIEKVTQIISLIYETSTVVSNSPADVSSLGKKITKEINEIIADPLYENITFIMISEKNLDTVFNNTAWGNRIFQSYSSKPLKKKGDLIFNSGTVKMSDEGFPDVISFKPELDFNSVRSSLITSAEGSRSTREGSMTVKDKNDAPPKKESEANVIVADDRTQSVNINELRDITIPLNTTDSMVGDAFIDFKRKETNMRKLFASKMNSAMTGELTIFGEPAWDELTILGFPFITFKHFTNNGSLSEYSGLWRVMASSHSISGGKFTTTLKLRKEFVDDIDPFNNQSIMSGNISVNPVNNEQKNS